MSRGYRKRRQRLAAHDAGHDRHSKGRSVEAKLARLAAERANDPTYRRRLALRMLGNVLRDEGWV